MWWQSRPVKLQGAPSALPQPIPNLSVAEMIFTDFRENYRRFEAWNTRQRSSVLQERYAHDRNLIYRDLRDDPPAQVDSLLVHRTHFVIAQDPDSCLVQLDSPLDTRGYSEWRLDGQPVHVSCPDQCIASIQPAQLVSVDAELEQTQFLSSVEDICHEFVCLWGPRWQKHRSLPPGSWDRILNFAAAFLPTGHFDLPPLCLISWKAALKRFKPRAARGPDGFALADLRNMPDGLTSELLLFLSTIEAGVQVWPDQWLLGLVCGLKKPNDAQGAEGYRPIVLLSIIYRCWSGLRARQLLRQLKALLPITALGFTPGREATEFWWKLEALIELSYQADSDLCGISTDVVKAFNCLPREPILRIASQLGFPSQVTTPWRNFLGRFQRRFLIRQCVSEPLESCTGFPEGCALSTVAMNVACLIFHTYLEAFGRSVTPHSYVDNLACTASSVGQLAHGINLCWCVLDLLDLQADDSKTYVWATKPALRTQLRALGLLVCTSARELGGVMSFCRATRNSLLVDRCKGTASLFSKLRRSRAPLGQKLAALPRKIWARALHGISACPLARAQLSSLRGSATKALQVCPAGSSAQLRLSLHNDLEADPGFYQLWATIRDLRRMCLKHFDVLPQWQRFMRGFTGALLHGPFSKLLQVLNEIGWSIECPPFALDCHGQRLDLLALPTSSLRRLLEQAWLDHVANGHRHRQQMHDLHGLDRCLLRHSEKGLTPLRLAQLNAIRSGAFLFDAAHCKFDLTVSGLCSVCSVPDTHEHRICQCPKFASAREGTEWVCALWPSLPQCLSHHLLPPASPHIPELQRCLGLLPDLSGNFSSSETAHGTQHLFVDGSCIFNEIPELSLAAWGTVNASTDKIIGSGHVPGLAQTVPRAELWAAICALRWGIWVRACIIIWSDSAYVVRGIRAILQGTSDTATDNADLWALVQDLVLAYGEDELHIQHVASHVCQTACESPLEEWLAHWNNRVDRLAGLANSNRAYDLATAHAAAVKYHQDTAAILDALFSIYSGIADITRTTSTTAFAEQEAMQVSIAPPESCETDTQLRLADEAPLNWSSVVSHACSSFPDRFVQRVFQFLFEQDACTQDAFKVSWLELVVLFLRAKVAVFPVRHLVTGLWVEPSDCPLARAPATLIVQLRVFRHVLRRGLRALQLQGLFVDRIDLSSLGVCFPLDGVCMGCASEDLQAARSVISSFCLGRSVKRLGALARPLSLD